MTDTDKLIDESYQLYQDYLNKWSGKRRQKDAIQMRKALSLLEKACKEKRKEVQLERKDASTK